MSDLNEGALTGARSYEALLVPALFQEWVAPVASAARIAPGHSVVDVACGTGVLAREALQRVGPSGTVVGIDVQPAMLAVAREREPAIDWRRAPADALPLEDESVDAVLSQFGMMFFPDRVAAAREMLRVLRPGARAVVAVWDALENQPAYQVEVDILESMAGEAAAEALRAPFVLGDPEEFAAIFREAGFDDVEVTTRTRTGRFPDVRTLVGADLQGWLPVMGVHLDGDTCEGILKTAERRMAHLVVGEEVMFDSPAHLLTARKA